MNIAGGKIPLDQCETIMKIILAAVKSTFDNHIDSEPIPVGVFNRHVHLMQDDLEKLFGAGYELKKFEDLSQPGRFICKETVAVCGPNGTIEKVQILGPVRKASQVKILAGDCLKLGIEAPVRLSGELTGTPEITLVGPKGSTQIKSGVMVEKRHIHMPPADAERLGIQNGESVCIEVDGERGGILRNTIICVADGSILECHLDVDEANAMGLDSSSNVRIIHER